MYLIIFRRNVPVLNVSFYADGQAEYSVSTRYYMGICLSVLSKYALNVYESYISLMPFYRVIKRKRFPQY